MPMETTLRRFGDADRKRLGQECLRLHEDHGVSWVLIAERKGVSSTTVLRWVGEAKPQVRESSEVGG